MKKVLVAILSVVLACSAFGQEGTEITPEEWEACERISRNVEAPYYFCECNLTSVPFEFPLELEVTDTMWFSSKLEDLEQGVSAFWFSNCAVTLEVYAFCTSKVPTLSFDVPANRMYEMSVEQIEHRLEGMGSTARELAGSVTPMIRFYPHDGGHGKAYVYPFDEGPESTCDKPMPLVTNMRYICDSTERTFRMDPEDIPDTTLSFLRWRHWNNRDCEVRMTLDSCNGEELMSTILTDTAHVFWLDTAKLAKTKREGRSIWMSTKAEGTAIGRLTWYEKPWFSAETDTINDTTCLGKALKVHEREYMADTSFVDTIAVVFDTLRLSYVNLTFTQPELEYDTVYVDPGIIRYGYRYQPSGDVFYQFGEYPVEVTKARTCTRAVLLNILDSREQGIEDVEAQKSRRARKLIRDGQLLIEKENEIFDVFGQKIIYK
jgi:hypothetical protein